MSTTEVTSPRTVKVGADDITIVRFRGLKAVLASALVARVMREIPEIQDRVNSFSKQYREQNVVVITPAMAKMPRFAVLGLTAEDFIDGKAEFPEDPTGQQVVMAILPDLFDLARTELQRFVALISISNQELERADDADAVDTALDILGKQLFRQGDVDELLELFIAGWEVLQDQIMSKKDKLGKLLEIPMIQRLLDTQDQSGTMEPIQPIYPEDVPSWSIDSEPPTIGPDETFSTVSPGTSS